MPPVERRLAKKKDCYQRRPGCKRKKTSSWRAPVVLGPTIIMLKETIITAKVYIMGNNCWMDRSSWFGTQRHEMKFRISMFIAKSI